MKTPKEVPVPSEPPRTRAIRQIPEPSRFWIAHAPRTWRCSSGLWTDLATGQLGGLRQGGELNMPQLEASDLDDLLYLPPVAKQQRSARNRLVATCVESQTPVLVQLRPGENDKSLKGAYIVYDLLTPVLKGDLEGLRKLPAASAAVWPLIPGIGDHSDFWEEALVMMSMAGVKVVQPVLLELSALARRRLAENRGDEVFDALFHGRPPSEVSFARLAHEHGIEVFWPRPASGTSPRQRNNRRIAADLALVGELWGRLGRSVAVGQALLRAARGAENTPQDLGALVREENLGVMTWLDARGMEIVEEIVKSGRSSLLDELMAAYLGLVKLPDDDPAEDEALDDSDDDDDL